MGDKMINPEKGFKMGEADKESSEEAVDVIFKVKLEKPKPAEVKISKKNICLVTIS